MKIKSFLSKYFRELCNFTSQNFETHFGIQNSSVVVEE
jgi:hypothetical protein